MLQLTLSTELRARRYVRWFVGLAVGTMALLGMLNYWVDPHAYFGRNTLGFYSADGEQRIKLLGLQRHPQDAVLIGNSKAAVANTALIHLPYVFYNAGVGGFMIENDLEILRHVSRSAPLVVVELDYLQFSNVYSYREHSLPTNNLSNWLNNLLSLQATDDSLATLGSVLLHRKPYYLADATFDPTLWLSHYDHGNALAHAQLLEHYENLLRNYKFVPQRLLLLEPLRAALQARGKPFLVYLPPVDSEEMTRIRRVGLGPAFDAWRASVHQVFPTVTDLTDSTYSDPKNFFRQDLVHPYPEVGARMIIAEVLPKLGK